MTTTPNSTLHRLRDERNIWLATVRPNGAPHLIPIWFVWHDEKIYICTGANSVKIRNLKANLHVALSLEDGSTPIMLEGTTRLLAREATPDAIVVLFQSKYNWNILTDDEYTVVIEVMPTKRRGW
jgi:nitroimidazol reductase NimA-like FMN-containing flavoprotein (pyridoxamine 5'-phosphate oxidase superfamily)